MEMKRKSFLLSMIFVLSLSFFLAACGQQADEGKSGEAEGQPVSGGTVTLSMFSAPKGVFNPAFYEDQYDAYVLQYTFDSLWAYDDKLQLNVPLLAEKWELSEDGKELTIQLRKDAKWHDGEPITADDLIFTWETIAHPDYSGPRYYMVEMIKGAKEMHEGKAKKLSGVTKVDDHTVKVEFTVARANTLDNLWSTPIPKHVYEGVSVKDMPNHEATKKNPVGSGPFKFKEIKPNEYVVLEKNPHFYEKGKPYLDQIIWKVISQDVAIAALENGEIDFLSDISPNDFDTIKAMEHIEIKETQDFSYQYLGFKLNNPKLKNKKLRQAIAYGINRKAMVDGLLKGHGAVLNQHMPKASWAYNEELEDAYPYDPDKAKQLLEEAGYKDKDGDGFVEDPKGKPFSLKLDYPTGNPIREKTAPIIAEDLKKIGLKVEVAKPREFAAHADAVEKDKVEMWLMGWSLTPDPDPSGIWLSTDPWNYPHWVNKESDKLIKEALESPEAIQDQNKRKEIYAKWTEVVSEDVPYVFLYSQNKIEAWNKRVKGVTFDWRGAIEHYKVMDWWIPKDQQ